MKKRLLLGAMAILILVSGTITAFAFATPNTNEAAAPSSSNAYEIPTTETEQLRITWGLPYTEASTGAIPKEEAKQIGLEALEEFFDTDLNQLGNYTLEIGYNPAFNPREILTSPPLYTFDGVDGRIPAENSEAPDFAFPLHAYRSAWVGSIIVESDRTPCPEGRMLRSHDVFRFRVDSQTGDLIGLQFFLSEDPIARPNMESECMGSPVAAFAYRDNMTAEHNIEYASFAMELAEEAGIFEGDVLRATIGFGGWMMGRDDSFELVITVALESENGETATLTFQGRNRKELVAVDFYSRMIDYAIDSDGNITAPRSQFVGNPDLSNWVYR